MYLQGEILRIKRKVHILQTKFKYLRIGDEIRYDISNKEEHRLVNLRTGEVILQNSSFINELNKYFDFKMEAILEQAV